MSKIVAHIEKIKRIHTCSYCLREFEWDKYCAWFGTIDSIEKKACSYKCRMNLNKEKNDNFRS